MRGGEGGGGWKAYHVRVAIESVDMLGEFLDRVFGEDTEATANDATERQALISNSQKSRKRRNQSSSLPLSQHLSATSFCLCWGQPQITAQSHGLGGMNDKVTA